METMRQDNDILSHQLCGQQRERERERERERGERERQREREKGRQGRGRNPVWVQSCVGAIPRGRNPVLTENFICSTINLPQRYTFLR